MKRRTALRLAACGFAGLAGCVSAGYDSPASGTTDTSDAATPTTSPAPTPDATEPPTGTATPTPVPDEPRIADQSFRVLGRECGTGEERANLSIDASRVVVEGTAVGSNGCETARLDAATYDPDTLTVVVDVYRPTGADACTQCLTDIDYRLGVRFEGGMPGRVRVVHGNGVVEESRVG